MVKVVICPGMHQPSLTDSFLANMGVSIGDCLADAIVYPAERYPPYSPQHLIAFLQQALDVASADGSLLFLGFSAGVVAAIGAARRWQRQGGQVAALIALDGWGVPLVGDFPIHRLSHDGLTHWGSALLGAGQDSFYADPAVTHLGLWQSPQTAAGWWVRSVEGDRIATTADQFLLTWLNCYGK